VVGVDTERFNASAIDAGGGPRDDSLRGMTIGPEASCVRMGSGRKKGFGAADRRLIEYEERVDGFGRLPIVDCGRTALVGGDSD